MHIINGNQPLPAKAIPKYIYLILEMCQHTWHLSMRHTDFHTYHSHSPLLPV